MQNTSDILLIDNDIINVLALKNILNANGYPNVRDIKPAHYEHSFFAKEIPSLIILNLDNTCSSNLHVLKKIYHELGDIQVPVLLVSQDINSELTTSALELGADSALAWPFTERSVLTHVHALVGEQDSGQFVDDASYHAAPSTPHQAVAKKHNQTTWTRPALDFEELQLTGYDALTGLANTASMRDYLSSAMRDISNDDRVVAALLFSLENFGDISKSLGLTNGDEILKISANRISGAIAKMSDLDEDDCFAARYSGGKFVVILNNLESETKAISSAHKVLAALSTPFELPNIVLDVAAQVGVSLAPRFTDEGTELLRQAEVALHNAKIIGQPLIVYEEEIDHYDPKRLAMMAELRKAINNNDLFLVYQPKINVKTGVISGVEALLRWQHPESGLIPPNEFIPMAEKSSVIKPLTVWVLNNALRQAALFAKSGLDITIAVNISASSLRDDSLVGYTKMLLQKNNIDPRRLIMEITESAMMKDPVMALNLLHQLSELGVQISIDDYGTGYSSLAYLKRMPVNEMKIDRTFVKDMASDEDDRSIVDTTINMGHNFGIRVVAEGVEDRESVELLTRMGVDQVQGYYYARPMPIDELYDWMTIDNKVAWAIR